MKTRMTNFTLEVIGFVAFVILLLIGVLQYVVIYKILEWIL